MKNNPIVALILTIFASVLLYNVSQTLKDARRIMEKAEEIVDQVNTYLLIPAKIFTQGYDIYKKFSERYAKKSNE